MVDSFLGIYIHKFFAVSLQSGDMDLPAPQGTAPFPMAEAESAVNPHQNGWQSLHTTTKLD